MISYLELIDKDIINLKNGENVGKFSDVEIDTKTGRILALYVDEPSRLFNFLKTEQPQIIKWEEIIKIGLDVIVVDYNSESIRNAGQHV